MPARFFVIFLALFGVLGYKTVDCTSAQNLHNLLRHPHYAERHQHALQHHLQRTTSHPSRRTYDSRAPSFPPTYSAAPTSRIRGASNDDATSLDPWSRAAPVSKDYYRMNGYVVKTTSASKGALIVDPRIHQELSEIREANEHFVRMRSGARCHIPRAQVFCVRDLYPDKQFLPRCTLLHRCSDSAGCCEEEGLQCAPKAMQEVALHFYVVGGDHRSSDVEKLFFVNHTECECQPVPKMTTEAPTSSTSSTTTTTTSTDVTRATVPEEHHPQKDQQQQKCRSCPSPFCAREWEDGRCSCDCFDRHKPCIRIKRGREALSDIERRCVQAGKCNVPDCEYGAYDPEKGRCPRRPDYEGHRGAENNGKRPYPNFRNPNHRWNYFERD